MIIYCKGDFIDQLTGTGWVVQPWLSVHWRAWNTMAVQSRRLGTSATNLALKVWKVSRELLVFSPCWEAGVVQSCDQWRRGQQKRMQQAGYTHSPRRTGKSQNFSQTFLYLVRWEVLSTLGLLSLLVIFPWNPLTNLPRGVSLSRSQLQLNRLPSQVWPQLNRQPRLTIPGLAWFISKLFQVVFKQGKICFSD